MITAFVAMAGFFMFMNPVDPHTIHPGAPHAQFTLSGYDFTAAAKPVRLPYARMGNKTIEVHFVFAAPVTGRCEPFELVTMNGVKGVAYPWGSGEGHIAIQGHRIQVDLALHTDAELHANGMTRDKPTIGMDCWKFHDETATVFSSLYQIDTTQHAPV